MAGYPRTRTQLLPTISGVETIQGSAGVRTRDNGYHTCTDIVGDKKGNHGLTIVHSVKTGGILSGARTGISNGSWDNVPLNTGNGTSTAIAYKYDEAQAALKGFNLSNPSRHDIKLPAFVAELRDLPKMLRFAGRILNATAVPRDMILNYLLTASGLRGNQHRRALSASDVRSLIGARIHLDQQGGLSAVKAVAAANLAWQFGWKPLIGDVSKMVGFTAAFEKRKAEINRLYSGRGLKRKITLQDEYNTSTQVGVTLHSVLGVCNSDVTTQNRTRIWTSVRWKPKAALSTKPADWQIAQNMLGLDVHGVLSSAWEILPWSWAIDWFSNIGDFLEISSNSMNATGYVNVMRTQWRSASYPGGTYVFSNGVKTISAYKSITETKTRKPGLPDLTALSVRLPILGDGQLSILASISMLRGKR